MTEKSSRYMVILSRCDNEDMGQGFGKIGPLNESCVDIVLVSSCGRPASTGFPGLESVAPQAGRCFRLQSGIFWLRQMHKSRHGRRTI